MKTKLQVSKNVTMKKPDEKRQGVLRERHGRATGNQCGDKAHHVSRHACSPGVK